MKCSHCNKTHCKLRLYDFTNEVEDVTKNDRPK